MIRMKEKRRELAAAAYAETTFADVVSISTSQKRTIYR